MKLLQLNTWMGRLTPQILKLITIENPDIITAQEMYDVDGTVIFPDNMFNLFDQIKSLKFEHSYFSPTWSMRVAHQKADFGNVIFSKFPIERRETFFTTGEYNPDLTPRTRTVNVRNAQLVEININGALVCIINHHGHWEITPQGSEVSTEKMKIVRDKICEQRGPIIFAGDLNLNPRTPALKLFDGILEDLTATYKLRSTLSPLGKVKNVACDHIFVNSFIKVDKFYASNQLVSDHKALILEFQV